ncbi:MAG: PLP-dependent aspartate aminotransferase family protein [Pseudomonadota bacterium]|nr:PLP-dependent aspartate aminotransferase family protein [Pseudomonadota bacterium]MEC9392551.1 PLP-dependent aspartate aminotransferase family protein [Pseudomonadota bacterium]MEC9458889.1 PLP-dependent aspartate aminotransferase family protein [Pseudomonadota bacterium]
MTKDTKKAFDTRAIHSGQKSDPTTGAIMTPIYASSTFAQEAPGEHKGYEYSRSSNPTRKALEDCISDLENGGSGHAFSSGMAATTVIMELLDAGDHIIACDDLYGGTYRLIEDVKKRSSNIKCDFIDFSKIENIEKSITKKTKMIWIESPTNPMLKIFDLKAIVNLAKSNDIILVCDNTFCSPWVQKPLDFGFDIVMHSATKYIGGHSDVIAGIAVVSENRPDITEKLSYLLNASGGILGPFESFLLLRSLKTLSVRMERHCSNAQNVAEFLENNTSVKRVIYPGLISHPDHKLAKRQMNMFGGMVSVILEGDINHIRAVLKKFTIFTLAESLGGVESLVNHPAIMTHASVPKDIRERLGIVDGLLRLSVGIEDISDIKADLDNALK